ncbi:MAG: cob(I)yrinic acid a,c-diamide adenosyltransferase [Acidobacteria bacterium]|nr:cob(I)yrinic acid a,c-diamide adenosyltransferase [Acidobacteriota bacterium]MDW7985035.1 cob(I)yrinic acid a,c-diamide adenosyltransferase [Acidobacteriota bacterium]
MKIYTRKGDAGATQLMGPTRVPKDHVRVEAYGSVDELNAWLGYVVALGIGLPWDERLRQIQHDLFVLGSYLAMDPAVAATHAHQLPPPPEDRVAEMEAWIDACEERTGPMQYFILPGGHPVSAALHVARTVARRVERRVVALHRQEPVPEWVLRYLNRLSDLLFMLARWVNAAHGVADVPWDRSPRFS